MSNLDYILKLIRSKKVSICYFTNKLALKFFIASENQEYLKNETIEKKFQKILKFSEENDIQIEFPEDYIIGDINDPYTHTQTIEAQELIQDEQLLGVIDIGPKSTQKIQEYISRHENIIMWGESGDSRVFSGSRNTGIILDLMINKKDGIFIMIGAKIENYIKNIFELHSIERMFFVGRRILNYLGKIFISEDIVDNSKIGDKEDDLAQQLKTGYEIFIGGLPSDTTKDDLFEYFSQFGDILKCCPQFWSKKIGKKKKCKGFGTIICRDKSTYFKILGKKLHRFKDRKIECKEKLKKISLLNIQKTCFREKFLSAAFLAIFQVKN